MAGKKARTIPLDPHAQRAVDRITRLLAKTNPKAIKRTTTLLRKTSELAARASSNK